VRRSVLSNKLRCRLSVGGRAGVNVSGSGGLSFHACPGLGWGGIGVVVPEVLEGVRRFGPLSMEIASRRRECSRCSCEEMKGAECRSPVYRVMSTMSRDWFRRVRRVVRGGRRSECVGVRVKWRGGWVRRRRARVWLGLVSYDSNPFVELQDWKIEHWEGRRAWELEI
jgi:hypothetical protein